MTKYQLLRQFIVGVLWLVLGAGCQKHPPKPTSCDNGTCCNADSYQYDYIEYIRDMPVNISYGGGVMTFSKPVPTVSSWLIKVPSVTICILSSSKTESLKTLDQGGNPKGVYQYKVSGKLFDNASWQVISGVRPLSIYIDNIEENR